MKENKDYYAILGVLPTAEDVVIRAAYKALAQRYHPDRYDGSPEDATRIMNNINKAYQVLSDAIKRKEYDDQRKTNKNNSYEPYEEEQYEEYAGTDPLEEQWQMAVEYYPDLVVIDKHLHNISSKLAYTFRAYILYEKKFQQGEEIANTMENTFLETYFGSNKEIIRFANKIILDGNKEAARELNKAIKLFGKDADADLVIGKITKIYYPKEYVEEWMVRLWEWADYNDIDKETIPRDIEQLTQLTSINLYYNHISDLPREIGQLTQLTSLELSLNNISNLPREIGQLTQLNYLDLSSNNLNELPHEIGQLTQLNYLDLSDNNLNELPHEIGQLTQLNYLDLSDNNLNELPHEIGQLTDLVDLYLRDNNLGSWIYDR